MLSINKHLELQVEDLYFLLLFSHFYLLVTSCVVSFLFFVYEKFYEYNYFIFCFYLFSIYSTISVFLFLICMYKLLRFHRSKRTFVRFSNRPILNEWIQNPNWVGLYVCMLRTVVNFNNFCFYYSLALPFLVFFFYV